MKRGFTLVEIILSIGLIVVIGVGSFIGFSIYKKYDKEKQLKDMNEEIVTALRTYIETSDEAKERIYQDKEGMAITLETLQNEGLIDFGNIGIDGEDYVVAMLSQESGCSDITTVESWDLTNGPLYICTNSSGGQNLFAVGGDADNLSKVTREPYIFKGSNPRNYISYNGNKYRILYIDIDDSIVLYHTSQFTNVFQSHQVLPIEVYGSMSESFTIYSSYNHSNKPLIPGTSSSTDLRGVAASFYDIGIFGELTASGNNASTCVTLYSKTYLSINVDKGGCSWSTDYSSPSSRSYHEYHTVTVYGYKIRLKPCMEITGGTGSSATPYELTANCPTT